MANTTKTGRRGAPVTERRRIPMGIRVTPELRDQLLKTAAANGRSITQEMEMRLENSFRSERYLDEAMDLAYGRQPTALLKLLGRLMVDVGPHAAVKNTGMFESAQTWMSDPFAVDQVAQGIATILEAMRPLGDVVPPDGAHPEMGQLMANGALIAIKDRECGGELGEWARPLRAGLGEAVDRLAVDPNAQMMVNALPPAVVRRGHPVESRIVDTRIGQSIGRRINSDDEEASS